MPPPGLSSSMRGEGAMMWYLRVFTNPIQGMVSQYFPGFEINLKGAFIGMLFSFSWGFLFAWLVAYLRNLFVAIYIYRIKRETEMLTFIDFVDNF